MNRVTDRTTNTSQLAYLVGLALPGQPPALVDEHLDELEELVRSAGAEVAGRQVQRRQRPEAATFIGRGKAEEAGREARQLGCALVVFDDDLTASQVKNLEKILDLPVMDRSGVILEIFNQRARTREARTQVELARLNYALPRLAGQWTHLSRQKGGIGLRGGEGEKQIEADRRVLRQRIRRLERDLEKIERSRKIQRRRRKGVVEIALAGYTNAGKSTLFNRLTQAGADVEDRLFATLDAKLRRGSVDGGRPMVFADTVGFIRKLPHHLVASFRTTLEEVNEADLVVHVIDRSHPQWREQQEVAEEVLRDLGVEAERIVTVFNKVDLLPRPRGGEDGAIRLSALTGEGIEELADELHRRLVTASGPFRGKAPMERERPGLFSEPQSV